MKSVVVYADGNLCVEERPVPCLQESDEVLIQVVCSGLCGSDIPRIFHHGAHYYPIILGHEFSGYILQCGTAITDIQVGDKVACVPLQPCFTCAECQRGYFSLCRNYQFIGSRTEGGNAELILLHRRNIFKLPDDIEFTQGAFIEPITVGLHAFHVSGGCNGKTVMIVGAGTIGLLALQSALALGARDVIAIDINEEKLALAKQLGASQVFNSQQMSAQQIQNALYSQRFDQLVLETAGAPPTVSLAIEIAGPRAQVTLVGTLHHDLLLPQHVFGQILRKELTILGSWMNYSFPWPGDEWKTAADLLVKQHYQLESLIAYSGEAKNFAKQVKMLQGRPMSGKLMLRFDV